MSTRTLNATAHNASRTLLYKMAYINLDDDLKAESECKPTTQREKKREGESLCAILKFPGSNQPEKDNAVISKSDAKKHAILQLSEENRHKLLLLASALENMDTSNKMSDCKLQKCLFDSTRQLNLKKINYDFNPSMHGCLFQSKHFEQCGVI